VIRVPNQSQIEQELHEVRRLVSSDCPIDVCPAVVAGRRCSVTSGPLKGLEGVVIRRRDSCRVHVAVEVLGQGAEVEIDAGLLQVIDD
jgi:transcription antitermination factor NusG